MFSFRSDKKPLKTAILLFTGLFYLTTLTISIGRADENYRLSEPLFDDTGLASLYITISADSLAWLLAPENLSNDRYLQADLHFQSAQIDTSIPQIGFRLRGNTSRESQKKSFKISFDEFEAGRRFYGLRKMNLNGEHNDPSVIRSKLCWDLFRKMGVPGSRAAHVRLYINGEYRGLYIHVEEYDKTFLMSRFGDNSGNLYKCLWPADLKYHGSDPDIYKYSNYGRRAYELQTNEDADDYSDLTRLITIINQTNDHDFADSVYAVFDLWNFLKYLAVNVAVGSWDDYWYNKNNFFLYHNLKTGRFEFLPYDYDNTFGICWDDYYWGLRDIYAWGNQYEDRPLVDRILENQPMKDLYSYFLSAFANEFFNAGALFARIDSLKNMISAAAEEDVFRTLDYGYTFDDFNNSYTSPLGGHVKYGLKSYVNTRSYSILRQVEPVDAVPFFIGGFACAYDSSDQLTVTVDVFDEDRPTGVMLHYQTEQEFICLDLELKSEWRDGPFLIYHYSTILPLRPAGSEFRFYLTATDISNQIGRLPFAAPDNLLSLTYPASRSRLCINELLAANSVSKADAYGEYDDWVEIYCDSDSFALTGFFLSDNFSRPDKYAFPDTLISAGDHLIIWADDQTEQGAWHAPFKLDKSGEFLAIFQRVGTTFLLVDSLTFGLQSTDISFGRLPDGGASWLFMSPSPGSVNSINKIRNHARLPGGFSVNQNYPNPFNGETVVRYFLPRPGIVKIDVLDINGRLVKTHPQQLRPAGENIWTLALHELVSGIYFIRVSAGNERSLRKCALIK